MSPTLSPTPALKTHPCTCSQVAIENLMDSAMLLPSVSFLAVPGVEARELGGSGDGAEAAAAGGNAAEASVAAASVAAASVAAAGAEASSAVASSGDGGVTPPGSGVKPPGSEGGDEDGGSDTRLQRDAGSSVMRPEAAGASGASTSSGASSGAAVAAVPPSGSPLAEYRRGLRALAPRGGARHYLWQLQQGAREGGGGGGSPRAAPGSGGEAPQVPQGGMCVGGGG